MSVDMAQWRLAIVCHVKRLADQATQRQDWFHCGPWNIGPRDDIAMFLDYAAALDFLGSADNGLNERQAANLMRLATMVVRLRETAPAAVRADVMIDDPRWRAVRRQARTTLRLLNGAG